MGLETIAFNELSPAAQTRAITLRDEGGQILARRVGRGHSVLKTVDGRPPHRRYQWCRVVFPPTQE